MTYLHLWYCSRWMSVCLNTLRPRQNGRHFPDDILKCIFLNENIWIAIKISLQFIPTVPINNIPALVQIMAWRRPGVKPLSETMLASLLRHICVTRPQWVKSPWMWRCCGGIFQIDGHPCVHNDVNNISHVCWSGIMMNVQIRVQFS